MTKESSEQKDIVQVWKGRIVEKWRQFSTVQQNAISMGTCLGTVGIFHWTCRLFTDYFILFPEFKDGLLLTDSILFYAIYSKIVDTTIILEQNVEISELKEQTIIDPLTGILNQRGIERALEQQYLKVSRSDSEIWIIFIDLDDLHPINKKFGHTNGGDVALKAITRAMQETIRGYETIARLGGDEFVISLDLPSDENSSSDSNSGRQIFDFEVELSISEDELNPNEPLTNARRIKAVIRRLQESIAAIDEYANRIDDPQLGIERIPIAASIACHKVNIKNDLQKELNEASAVMFKVKEIRKKGRVRR